MFLMFKVNFHLCSLLPFSASSEHFPCKVHPSPNTSLDPARSSSTGSTSSGFSSDIHRYPTSSSSHPLALKLPPELTSSLLLHLLLPSQPPVPRAYQASPPPQACGQPCGQVHLLPLLPSPLLLLTGEEQQATGGRGL